MIYPLDLELSGLTYMTQTDMYFHQTAGSLVVLWYFTKIESNGSPLDNQKSNGMRIPLHGSRGHK